MTWPFRTLRERLLERDVALLKARLGDLEAQNVKAWESERYFRERYERLADMVLFRQGDIASPIHVEPAKQTTETVNSKVTRIANLVGNATGVDFTKRKSPYAASDLPSHGQ